VSIALRGWRHAESRMGRCEEAGLTHRRWEEEPWSMRGVCCMLCGHVLLAQAHAWHRWRDAAVMPSLPGVVA
jgi:hypothetical protein